MSVARYVVTKVYRSPYEQGITFHEGERLQFERRVSEWEGWIWCTSASGESAWTPESRVRFEGVGCVMTRDYCSSELSVEQGEQIAATLEESGWVLATNASGDSGWVPLDHLQKM